MRTERNKRRARRRRVARVVARWNKLAARKAPARELQLAREAARAQILRRTPPPNYRDPRLRDAFAAELAGLVRALHLGMPHKKSDAALAKAKAAFRRRFRFDR